jgi:hypothetical protein
MGFSSEVPNLLCPSFSQNSPAMFSQLVGALISASRFFLHANSSRIKARFSSSAKVVEWAKRTIPIIVRHSAPQKVVFEAFMGHSISSIRFPYVRGISANVNAFIDRKSAKIVIE